MHRILGHSPEGYGDTEVCWRQKYRDNHGRTLAPLDAQPAPSGHGPLAERDHAESIAPGGGHAREHVAHRVMAAGAPAGKAMAASLSLAPREVTLLRLPAPLSLAVPFAFHITLPRPRVRSAGLKALGRAAGGAGGASTACEVTTPRGGRLSSVATVLTRAATRRWVGGASGSSRRRCGCRPGFTGGATVVAADAFERAEGGGDQAAPLLPETAATAAAPLGDLPLPPFPGATSAGVAAISVLASRRRVCGCPTGGAGGATGEAVDLSALTMSAIPFSVMSMILFISVMADAKADAMTSAGGGTGAGRSVGSGSTTTGRGAGSAGARAETMLIRWTDPVLPMGWNSARDASIDWCSVQATPHAAISFRSRRSSTTEYVKALPTRRRRLTSSAMVSDAKIPHWSGNPWRGRNSGRMCKDSSEARPRAWTTLTYTAVAS